MSLAAKEPQSVSSVNAVVFEKNERGSEAFATLTAVFLHGDHSWHGQCSP